MRTTSALSLPLPPTRNHSEGGGVEEQVVVLVVLPPDGCLVSQPVVEELPEVGADPDDEEGEDEVAPAVGLHAAVRHGVVVTSEVQGQGWAEGGRQHALEHLGRLM